MTPTPTTTIRTPPPRPRKLGRRGLPPPRPPRERAPLAAWRALGTFQSAGEPYTEFCPCPTFTRRIERLSHPLAPLAPPRMTATKRGGVTRAAVPPGGDRGDGEPSEQRQAPRGRPLRHAGEGRIFARPPLPDTGVPVRLRRA